MTVAVVLLLILSGLWAQSLAGKAYRLYRKIAKCSYHPLTILSLGWKHYVCVTAYITNFVFALTVRKDTYRKT